MLKRYTSGAWTDVENLKRYSGGSWADCESAKRYDGSAWAEVWPGHLLMKYGWTYTTGSTNPTYEHNLSGRSCHLKITNQSASSRSELVLTLKYPLDAGDSCHITLNSDRSATSANTALVINFSNDSGLYQTMQTVSSGTRAYSFTVPDGGITHINLVLQVYGASGVYAEADISDLYVNGEAVWFSNTSSGEDEEEAAPYTVKYGWTSTTGSVNPVCTYTASGTSCTLKLTNKSANYRSEAVLQMPCSLAAGSTCAVKLTLSGCATTASAASTALVINFSNKDGLWQTMGSVPVSNGAKNYSFTVPSGGVTSVNLILQVYGAADVYTQISISDLSVQGNACRFQ